MSDVRRWSALPHAAEMVVRNFNGHLSIENVEVVKASDYDALLAKLAVAVEALRPFADLLQGHHDLLSDDYPIFGINNALFTAGDLRHAAEALAQCPPLPKEKERE